MLSATLPSARACEPEPVAVAVAAPVAAGTAAAASETVMTTSGALPGPGEWIHGAAGEPALQCHRLDQAGTAWVIRFSKWLAGEHVGTDAENTFRPAYGTSTAAPPTLPSVPAGPPGLLPFWLADSCIGGSCVESRGQLRLLVRR